MKNILLCALCVLCGEFRGEFSESVCVHPSRGESRPVSLDAVRKAQESVKARFAWTVEQTQKISLDTPFDSRLPACSSRNRRSVRAELPRELVGKTIAFAPAERMPPADFRIATSARRLVAADADGLADETIVRRLGVRCAPTRVTVKSESELELVENP